jgi:hypothetical protein
MKLRVRTGTSNKSVEIGCESPDLMRGEGKYVSKGNIRELE